MLIDLHYNGELYIAKVKVYKQYCEFDNDYETHIQSIKLIDEYDNRITKSHPDYDDLVNEVIDIVRSKEY